jgi:hypothetical protein
MWRNIVINPCSVANTCIFANLYSNCSRDAHPDEASNAYIYTASQDSARRNVSESPDLAVM